jgi:hypothetical protein
MVAVKQGASPADKAAAYRIAAETGLDPRTCLKALRSGVEVLRSRVIRERLAPLVAAYRASLELDAILESEGQ